MTRYTIISTDCHTGPPHSTGGFRDYVGSGFREQLGRDVAEARDSKKLQEDLFAEDFRAELDQSSAMGAPADGVELCSLNDLATRQSVRRISV